MRFASVVIVVSRVESLLGSAVEALEREEREEEFRFQMVDLGGVPPIFVSRQGWRGSCSGRGLGELPKFDIRYFQYPFSNT